MTRQKQGRRTTAGKGESLTGKDLRRLLQLVACGSLFVALVAAKLLLPARMAVFNEKLSAAMEQNLDVQAVFSAVGRAFFGEGNQSLEEVYQAVFHPQEETAGEAELTTQTDEMTDLSSARETKAPRPEAGGALEVLKSYRGERIEVLSPEETPEASDLAYILYSQENLPEGVSMEQVILGFDYSAPVKGGVVSSDFGYREHPVEGEERFHYGVDLAADTGTEVDCFADGTVTAVGDSSSYGRYCVVEHQGGYSTLYAHCSRITATSGAAVKRGEKIAEVGDTGIATGPHLHFELQNGGAYLNPIYYVSAL